MPEAITIKTDESPALSPENIEMLQAEQSGGEEAPLLAGKYKSVDELEKAYKELQSKLGGRPKEQEQESQPQAADDTEPEAEAEEEPEAQSAKEIYGDFIGGRLEEAGIDFSDMNTRWQQSGELTGEDYDQLSKAGFTKDMVDAYLAGLNYQAAKDSALSAQQVADVKAAVGGEKEYSAMVEWASRNLSAEEVEAFDQIVNTQPMSTIKLAVQGLYSRYTGAVGREPKLLGGRTPRRDGDVFESTAQVVEAMSDPKYNTDPAYRKRVTEKLARSNVF